MCKKEFKVKGEYKKGKYLKKLHFPIFKERENDFKEYNSIIERYLFI